jgi:hypothetical protein
MEASGLAPDGIVFTGQGDVLGNNPQAPACGAWGVLTSEVFQQGAVGRTGITGDTGDQCVFAGGAAGEFHLSVHVSACIKKVTLLFI